jgi:peptidoglycan/LPS O-acetylase OafA/YrhL
VAILLVLFHHVVIYSGMTRSGFIDRAVHAVGNSTWLGVDLFFVLSGFLITGILYDARSSPRYFASFYGRRVLRIFPLYYGFLAAWLIVGSLGRSAPAGEGLADGLGWYWAYLSNVQVARSGWQEPLHLGHFWSLAVEEQFYLIWPFVVLAFDRRRLMQVCILSIVAAFVLRTVAPFGLTPLGAYVLMPTRMDALAAGAFLALAARGPDGLRGLGAWPRVLLIGCTAAAAAVFVWRRGFADVDPAITTVGLTLFAVGFAAMIADALTAPAGSSLRRIFCAAPLAALGQYSYGLYVFHQPITMFLRDAGWQAGMLPSLWGSQLPGLAAFGAMVCIASALCAVASWHLWEAPFLRLKRYLPYRPAPPDASVGQSEARASAGHVTT